MTNFLEETTEVLKDNNKTWKDVVFIRNKDKQVADKEAFIKSMDFEYDAGFGSEEIDDELLIVGDGWWLERHEYDGSEWWEYKECPKPLSTSANYVMKMKEDLGFMQEYGLILEEQNEMS